MSSKYKTEDATDTSCPILIHLNVQTIENNIFDYD